MNKKEWNEGLCHLDPDLVEKYVLQKDRLRQNNNQKNLWVRFGAIAACFVVILSAIIVVPILLVNDLPDVPIWDNAQYSADEIAKLFNSMKYDSVATNAYTKIYVPDSKYLYINDLPNEEYLNLYQYEIINNKLNKNDLRSFIENILPKLASSLGVSVPQYNIEEDKYTTGNTLSSYIDMGSYFVSFAQNSKRNSFSLSKLEGDRQIVIEGEIIQINQLLSDEEILESIQSIKNKLFNILNVSFSDVKIIRNFNAYSKYGVVSVYIYFYDENAHSLNSLLDRPISDYICISFDNAENYSGDIVSADVLKVSGITYDENRINVGEAYTNVAKAKKISISEAEALLYNGYVFGGHSCLLCMKLQDKVSFEGYDFVDIEYVFGYNNKTANPTDGMPFYAFYKNIGTSENGNTIYAKTYVPAIQVSGYKEFFESQKDDHSLVDEVG